jgi:hypothetical protein
MVVEFIAFLLKYVALFPWTILLLDELVSVDTN